MLATRYPLLATRYPLLLRRQNPRPRLDRPAVNIDVPWRTAGPREILCHRPQPRRPKFVGAVVIQAARTPDALAQRVRRWFAKHEASAGLRTLFDVPDRVHQTAGFAHQRQR